MLRFKTLVTTASLISLAALFMLSGCDVRILYGSHDDEDPITDERLLAVLYPDGSRPYDPGDTLQIRWRGSVDADTVMIDLHLSGEYYDQIAGMASNTGVYEWTIPADFEALTEVPNEYRISIRARKADHEPGDLYVQALSEPFTIGTGTPDGLTDVTVNQRIVTITVTDNGQQIDGDTIDIVLNGTPVVSSHVLVAPPGTNLEVVLAAGDNLLEIIALNEGTQSPNTAQLEISNVTSGEALQQWRLSAGETGSLVINAP